MSEQVKNKENQIQTEFVVCMKCGGNGLSDNGMDCPACGGKGVFLEVNKNACYYWGKRISGYSSVLRDIRIVTAKVIDSLAYVLALFSFIYGLFFIASQNQDFVSNLREEVESSGADKDMFVAVFRTLFYFATDILNAFLVIFEKRGSGPLLFWLGCLGVMYFHYHSKAAVMAHKNIDILAREFKPFYDQSASSSNCCVDISDYLSSSTILIFEKALDLAYDQKQIPQACHLAKALLSEREIMRLNKRLEIDSGNFSNYLDGIIAGISGDSSYLSGGFFKETVMSLELKKLSLISFEESLLSGFDKIEPESLFLALLYDPHMEKYFHDLKLERPDVRNAVLWSKKWGQYRVNSSRPRKIEHNIMNKAWTARVTPELDQFSYDMTDYARSGLTGTIVNRVRELDNLMRILERTSKNNALLIGEEGSGRTTIVKALANRMIRDDVLPTLKDKRLVVLDVGALVAGVQAGGDLEMRIRKVLEDMGKSGNIILYIPDIHNMASAGSGGEFDASKALAPILSQGLFQIIGSTDYKNYRRYIEPRADFANNFDFIKIEELSEEDALKVLAIQAGMIESRENIIMSYGAIKKAVELSKRYIPDRLLPGKAIDLLSETAVEVRRRGAESVLRDEDVMGVITEKTGIPLNSINSNEAEKLLNLEDALHARVIGQEQAIKSVASAIRRVRVGMKMQNRPVGTFLFLGPTGVGKTELAKALAEVYYGSENAMIRLDMSEYQTIESVEKLIGFSNAAEGDGGGVLTEAVKHKPFSLILLDELEKANKNVLNVFLQVFDDGRLTDNLGRTVDFTNTIIIATSNAGSSVATKMYVDESVDNASIFRMMEPYLLQYFAPEFLNRFTDKVIFRSLTQGDLLSIVRLQVKQLAQRLDKAQGIKVDVTEEAICYLGDIGYSPEYGARFLQRTLQEKLENLIAVEFLKGNIKRGDTFRINADNLKKV